MLLGTILKIDEYEIVLEKNITDKLYECKSTKNSNISLCARVIKTKRQHLREYQERERQIYEVILSHKNNQNLVNIHLIRTLEEQKMIVIIMEKCESNLQEIWEKKKTFDDFEIEDFFKQLIIGYKVLYHEFIIHRDIKPENIFVRYINGNPIYKIANFQFAKRFYNDNNIELEKFGTPVYAAPEINPLNQDEKLSLRFNSIKNIENPKSQIDVYSIGMILYQMVYGQLPFGLNFNEIVQFLQQIKQKPLKLQGNSKYIQIIEGMLIYFPDYRTQFKSFFKMFQFEPNKKQEFQNFEINQIQPINRNPFQNLNYQQQSNIISQRFNTINNINIGHQYNNNQGVLFQRIGFMQQYNPIQNQLPQSLLQINFNPRQNIIEFLIFLLHDFDGILSDSIKQHLQSYLDLKDMIFIEKVLKELLSLFHFKIEKLNNYDSKTLNFFYSIFIILNQPGIQQQPQTSDNLKRVYIQQVAIL